MFFARRRRRAPAAGRAFRSRYEAGQALEARLTMTWGAVPPTTVSPVAPTAVALNAQNSAAGSAAITAGEVDYYSFTAGVSGNFTLAATATTSGLDTVLGLFNSNGQRLAYNDDSGGTTNSQLTAALTSGSRYYVGITNYTGSVNGNYNWSVTGPAPLPADDAYESNNTQAAAFNLGTLTARRTINNLVMADAADWYKFTTASTGGSANNVTIGFTHSLGDLDLELYNAAGTRLKSSAGTTNSETVSLSGLAAGTYFIRVFGYRGATNPNYTLDINPPGAAASPTIDLAGATTSVTSAAQWGTTISVSSSVQNTGNTASGGFGVQWYLSRDTAGSADDVLLVQAGGATTANYASVAGGAVGSVLTTTLQLPGSLPSGWTGSTFYVVMKTDSGGVVSETNENNNFGQAGLGKDSAGITITATPPSSGGFHIELVISGMTASQQLIFQQAAAKWEAVITGDLPNENYNGVVVDDLLINASAAAIDGAGGILGQAGPDRFRSGTYLPYHGSMEFDSADLAAMERDGSLRDVIVHEMGHVLGIGTIWDLRGLLSGAGTTNPIFVGAQATAAYNQIFGTNAAGVPVENSGGSGTRDSHWRESILVSEVMTGYAGPGVNLPLSRITVASLADLGYSVNLAAADAYTRPAGVVVAGSSGGSGAPALASGSASGDPAAGGCAGQAASGYTPAADRFSSIDSLWASYGGGGLDWMRRKRH